MQAFFDTYRDQTLVEVNRNNEAVLKKQLDATRDRFRVGEVTRTDVAQAESSLAQATANRIAAEGQLESQPRQLSRARSVIRRDGWSCRANARRCRRRGTRRWPWRRPTIPT